MEKVKEIFLNVLSKITSSRKRLIGFTGGAAAVILCLTVVFIAYQSGQKTPDMSLELETEPEITSEPVTEEPDFDEDDDFFEDDEDYDDEWDEDLEKDPSVYQPAAPQKYYSHLTGIRVTRTKQRKRPVSVIINNISVAMPNVGISRADIIYECLAEGGITRLMMVLADYENVAAFGSVRSSREYFIDLSRSHDTIYVHAGGNPQDYDELLKRKIDAMDGVNKLLINGSWAYFSQFYYRDAERRKTMASEHTLMISGEGIVAGIEQQNYRKTHERDYKGPFNFNEKFTEMSGGAKTANYVCVPYSAGFKPEFIYNPEDKLYYRKQFGKAHIDGETEEQIRFENVIILFAEYTPYRENAIAIREGHLACNLTGTGYGFYISGGKYKTIRWQKDTRDSVLNLFETDKSELYLNPGKSFVCVTSTAYNKSVVINSDIKSVD